MKVFASRARDHLGTNIGVVPPLSLDVVEVNRVRAIAQSVLDAGMEVLGEASLKVDTDLSDPMMAHYLDERLRRFGSNRTEPADPKCAT